MRSARYRLRFFTGATLSSATYGGGLYGDDTYGMEASDSLTTAHHRLVPWPAGSPTGPSWTYREGDTQPAWEAQIIADDGVVDYTGLESALLILTEVHDPEVSLVFSLTIVTAPNGDQRLHHTWQLGELNTPGVYRVSVVLVYVEAGRWMTAPAEDMHTLVVTSGG